MNLVEKRRANLINLTYYAFLIAAYYFFMKYAFWLVAPFVIAFAVAMVLQKPLRVISKKTKIKKSILAAIAVLLILAIIISAVVFVGYKVFVEFKGLGQYLMEKVNDLPNLIRSAESWIISKLAFLPDAIEKSAFSSNVQISADDKFITLSTCSYEFDDARFVLVGVLDERGPPVK